MPTFSTADASLVSSDPIAHSLDDLRQACDAAIGRLKAQHHWTDADGRVQAIHRLRNIAQSLLAALVFNKVVFPSRAFWETFFQTLPTPADMDNHYLEFDVLVRFAGLQGMFSAAESDLRKIVHALDPAACSSATAEFASISAWLLARATTAGGQAEFLDLMRLTRNTIHTNGVHLPRNGLDVTKTVGGNTYHFRVNQPIAFVDWSFVAFTGMALVSCLEAVANDPIVAALPTV